MGRGDVLVKVVVAVKGGMPDREIAGAEVLRVINIGD
jgi:hypothetical protein